MSNRPKETATATTQQQTIHQSNVAAWCRPTRTTITNGRGKIATVCPLAHSTAGTTRLWWRRTTRTPTRILTSLIATEGPREATARTPGTGFERWPTVIKVKARLSLTDHHGLKSWGGFAVTWRNYYTHLDCNNLVSMCSTSFSLWPWLLPNEHLNLDNSESCSCCCVSKGRDWIGK